MRPSLEPLHGHLPEMPTPQPHKRLGSSIGLGLLIVGLIVYPGYGLLTGNADR